MTETENGDTTPLKPRKREGSRLDRGFPMVKILLIILGFVFFFQIISAWKIINLEKEKGKLEDEKTVFETNKENYYFIMQKLPELQRTNGELETVRHELRGEINDLKLESIQVVEELKKNQKLSTELKSANKIVEINLRDMKKLASEKKSERDELNREASSLNAKITDYQSDINVYQDKERTLKEGVGRLEEEKKILELEIARLGAREDELLKLKNSNTELMDIVKNLKNTPQEFNQFQGEAKAKFENAVKGLESTTDTIKRTSQKFTQSQSEANAKFKETVDNLNNTSSKLVKITTNYSTKIEQATTNLNENIVQLSTMRSELANLPLQLNNSANQVDNELKIVNQRLKEFETSQKQLEKLLANTTSISGSLSSDSSALNNVLKELKENVGDAVQKLGVATSNIESKSNDFNEKVSTLDISNRELNSLLDNIKHIYKELDTIKQRQIELADNSQDLVKRIKQSFGQIKNDSSSAIEDIKGLKDTVKEVEKKIESLNIGTEKPNEKEEE